LLGNFRNSLLSIKDELLDDGKPLVKFPRIWMLALSKADLLPDFDVFRLRDLLIDKAADEIDELRNVLMGFVEYDDAMAVFEDYLLLSSAKFNSDKIEVSERVGLDLILPLAAMLPFERHTRWAKEKQIGAKLVEEFIFPAVMIAATIAGGPKILSQTGRMAKLVSSPKIRAALVSLTERLGNTNMDLATVEAAKFVGDRLTKRNSEALANQEFMAAVLTKFQMNLNRGEDERVLLRSQR